MKRTLITPDLAAFPEELRPVLSGASVYDSSSSPQARVYFIDKDGGYYLKTAEKGELAREAELTRYSARVFPQTCLHTSPPSAILC